MERSESHSTISVQCVDCRRAVTFTVLVLVDTDGRRMEIPSVMSRSVRAEQPATYRCRRCAQVKMEEPQ